MEEDNTSQASIQYPPSSPTISTSTSTVLGMPGQLNLDAVSASADIEEGEFYRRCELLINGVLGGNDRKAADVLTALMAFADLSPGAAPLDVAGKVRALQYLREAVRGAVGGDVDGVMHEAGDLVRMATQRSEKSSLGRGGGARKRGGGVGEEAAVEAAIQAVAAADQGNQQPLAAMGGRVVQAAEPVVAQSQGEMGGRLAAAGVEGAVQGSAIRAALETIGQGLSCAGGAIGGGAGWIIGVIRATAQGTVYQVRQRVASFTAGVVTLGTWAAGYWSPGSMARSACMTVLTPFMTRTGAGPWCGVEVPTRGMFHAAQQFAASLAPGGAFWETLGIFGTATTERYDTAARAVFVTVTALVVIGFGSWSGLIGAISGSTRRAAARALSGLNQYFTGAVTAQDALRDQLQSTYDMLANTWTERGGRINEEDSFQACLAIAVALGANREQLMAGGSAFGGLARYVPSAEVVNAGRPQQEHIQDARLIGLQNDFGPNQTPGGLGFSLSIGGVDAPGHSPTSLPNELQNEPRLIDVIEALLTNVDVAHRISNLPAPRVDLADPARAKYMQLRNLLQLAALTAGALTRARAEPESMSDATQQALQEQLQRTMETYRDMRINSLLAAEDLAVAFATNVGAAIMQDQPAPGAAPGQQGGGRRRRRTRRNKPRSRARRKENKRKTRLGKRRRTRRH